jgi:multiple sugar transport system permease protein
MNTVRQGHSRRPTRDLFRYQLVAPSFLVLVIVGLLPFFYTIMISFQGLSLIDQDTRFQGFSNYTRSLGDVRLWSSLFHTAIIMAFALPLQLVLGLWMAYHFLEERTGKKLFIALLIIPSVISPVVAGSMWRLLFDNRFGPINQIIGFPLGEPVKILWSLDPVLAYVAIIVAEVWEWTPFMFVILLAALSNVDRDQLDAAAIDGAGRWNVFRHIAVPGIWPVLTIALMIRALDMFRIFDLVWQVTRGGPGTATETVSIYMFVRGFEQFETSYVAAQVVLLSILLSFVIVTALRRLKVAR